jgi:enamine deaminase RidA (YjgF/YER057c/UK114 family)
MKRVWLLLIIFVIFTANTTLAADDQKAVYHKIPSIEAEIGYSQAVKVGKTIYISGTTGYNSFGVIPNDMSSQIKYAYQNIKETLAHYQATFDDVVYERIYTTNISLLKENENILLRKSFYSKNFPPSLWVEVKSLYEPKALVEIEIVAYLEK